MEKSKDKTKEKGKRGRDNTKRSLGGMTSHGDICGIRKKVVKKKPKVPKLQDICVEQMQKYAMQLGKIDLTLPRPVILKIYGHLSIKELRRVAKLNPVLYLYLCLKFGIYFCLMILVCCFVNSPFAFFFFLFFFCLFDMEHDSNFGVHWMFYLNVNFYDKIQHLMLN